MEALSKPRVCFEFEVEKVLGVSSDGRYQVQYAPTWVSKFHLVGCEHLIQEFLRQQSESEIEINSEHEIDKQDVVSEMDPSRKDPCTEQSNSNDQTSVRGSNIKVEVGEETNNIDIDAFRISTSLPYCANSTATTWNDASTSTNMVIDYQSAIQPLKDGACPGNDLILENNKANDEVISEVVGEESQAHRGEESGQSQRFGEKAGSGQSQRKKPLTGYHLHLRELSESGYHMDATIGELSSIAGLSWQSLDDIKREEYNERAKALNTYPTIRQLTCSTCGNNIKDDKEGRRHVRNCGEVACDICSKVFKSKDHLRRHQRIHSKEFHCGLCNKNFCSAQALSRHGSVHSGK